MLGVRKLFIFICCQEFIWNSGWCVIGVNCFIFVSDLIRIKGGQYGDGLFFNGGSGVCIVGFVYSVVVESGGLCYVIGWCIGKAIGFGYWVGKVVCRGVLGVGDLFIFIGSRSGIFYF